MLPRYWRFRLALPVDARGKLPAAALSAMFAEDSQGPEILTEALHDGALLYDLRVPPGLEYFDGHFPGMPILPGVVQVNWAIRFAARQHLDLGAVASIDRLKFTAPVLPGALLRLTLKHDAVRRRTSFLYQLGERDCSSGMIVYRTA
jgi:3-hydroxymyristoyl/3-hydroxydecanoyl-(acyl carrier protein) dehydratase